MKFQIIIDKMKNLCYILLRNISVKLNLFAGGLFLLENLAS